MRRRPGVGAAAGGQGRGGQGEAWGMLDLFRRSVSGGGWAGRGVVRVHGMGLFSCRSTHLHGLVVICRRQVAISLATRNPTIL